MDLNRDAMLVGLRITAWSGRLYDREASDHVAAHHDASASAGRYNKRLLPKAAFAALTSIMSEARTKHYENSLPWDDKGARLLTVTNYAHYTELMNALRERVVRQRARFAGFDTFSARSRPARRCRNPRTGESIAIAASRTPAFKAGKTLRDQLNARRPDNRAGDRQGTLRNHGSANQCVAVPLICLSMQTAPKQCCAARRPR